jgi:hypothetical protein
MMRRGVNLSSSGARRDLVDALRLATFYPETIALVIIIAFTDKKRLEMRGYSVDVDPLTGLLSRQASPEQ